MLTVLQDTHIPVFIFFVVIFIRVVDLFVRHAGSLVEGGRDWKTSGTASLTTKKKTLLSYKSSEYVTV